MIPWLWDLGLNNLDDDLSGELDYESLAYALATASPSAGTPPFHWPKVQHQGLPNAAAYGLRNRLRIWTLISDLVKKIDVWETE